MHRSGFRAQGSMALSAYSAGRGVQVFLCDWELHLSKSLLQTSQAKGMFL